MRLYARIFRVVTGSDMASKPATKKQTFAGGRRYGDILYEVKDQVAWVTINRPRVMNAFREQTLDELIDALGVPPPTSKPWVRDRPPELESRVPILSIQVPRRPSVRL